MKSVQQIVKGVLLLFVVLICGCKDFIEPSLSAKTVKLLAPGDQLESSNYQQTFWWEKQEDALYYRLQMVSPKFDSIEKLILDTVVQTDKFLYTVDPGRYQWRVRAENGSSQTQYSTRGFVVYPTSLTTQMVQVTLPASAVYFAKSSIQYAWLKLFGATQYRLQVDQNNFVDETKLTLNVLTDQMGYEQLLSTEGRYQFRVRAENATETSKWSVTGTFTYDATAPAKVVLTVPANKKMVEKPVKLTWDAVSDAVKYEVAIYKSDSTTYYTAYPLMVTSNTATFSGGDANETLIWRVRAIDMAGNKGVFSDYFSFMVQ